MTDLNTILEYLATELLGWERDRFPAFNDGSWSKPKNHFTQLSNQELYLHLLTGNGMLEVVEAMRDRGFLVSCTSLLKEDGGWTVFIVSDENDWDGYADTLPEAVCRAAYEALHD